MSPASISTQSEPPAPSTCTRFSPALCSFSDRCSRHRGDLPVGQAGRDHHAVAERRLACQIQRHDVLRLVVLQAADDHRLQPLQRRRLRPCVSGAPQLVAGRRRSSSCAACRASCRPQAASAWRPSCAARRGAARARTVSAAWLWHGSFCGWRGSRWPRRRAAARTEIPRPARRARSSTAADRVPAVAHARSRRAAWPASAR